METKDVKTRFEEQCVKAGDSLQLIGASGAAERTHTNLHTHMRMRMLTARNCSQRRLCERSEEGRRKRRMRKKKQKGKERREKKIDRHMSVSYP
jgi:hypothetical protein